MRQLVSLLVVVTLAVPAFADKRDLSWREVYRVIKARKGAFQACYTKELQRDPALEAGGHTEVAFTIKPDGKVASAAVTKAFHPRVDACVVREVKRLVFPAPRADLKVSYPFKFGG